MSIKNIPTDGAFVPSTDSEEPLNNLAIAIAALAQAGAKNFLVPNLPDLGQLPTSQAETNSSVYTQVSLAHNAGLANGLQALNPEIRLTELDVFSAFNQVLANPGAFGFTNTENPCLLISQFSLCSSDPTVQNQYVFWDEHHRTTAVHKILGDLAYDALQQDTTEVPEPTVVFSVIAVGAMGTASLRRRKSA